MELKELKEHKMPTQQVLTDQRVPVKIWTDDVDVFFVFLVFGYISGLPELPPGVVLGLEAVL